MIHYALAGDTEFTPPAEEAMDVEETIAEAEKEVGEEEVQEELEGLQKESEMDLEELMKTLPPRELGINRIRKY